MQGSDINVLKTILIGLCFRPSGGYSAKLTYTLITPIWEEQENSFLVYL